MSHVEVSGISVAAASVTRLLRRAGFTVKRVDAAAPRVPAVMLGTSTRKLWSDVFEPAADPFADLWQMERRRVLWGNAPEAVLPHRAWVLTSGETAARLDALPEPKAGTSDEPAWRIHAGGLAEIPSLATSQAFGHRQARAWPVVLRAGADARACVVESLANGWLFLLPVCATEGWLLVVGELDAAAALASSRLAGTVIDRCEPAGGVFECHPRLTMPVAAAAWLCCGSAAAGFDPLCGDGVGNALREAILASAVVAAAHQAPELTAPAAAHYERQLRAAMFRHLQLCESFYSTGGDSPWWRAQRDSARAGAASIGAWLGQAPPPRFRLEGFALQPLAGQAG